MSGERDVELRRLLHDLRSGLVGIGAVAAAIRARLDAGALDADKTRAELALVERTVDSLDGIVARARELLAPQAPK